MNRASSTSAANVATPGPSKGDRTPASATPPIIASTYRPAWATDCATVLCTRSTAENGANVGEDICSRLLARYQEIPAASTHLMITSRVSPPNPNQPRTCRARPASCALKPFPSWDGCRLASSVAPERVTCEPSSSRCTDNQHEMPGGFPFDRRTEPEAAAPRWSGTGPAPADRTQLGAVRGSRDQRAC